jgi:hypothetical protein
MKKGSNAIHSISQTIEWNGGKPLGAGDLRKRRGENEKVRR